MDTMDKEWYGAGEVALLLGVHRNTVSRWCRRGWVVFEQFGAQGGYFLPRAEVERLTKDRGVTLDLSKLAKD